MSAKRQCVNDTIPPGYTIKKLNGKGYIPWWNHIGDLPYRALYHYRGIPYRLDMKGTVREGYYLAFSYWWDNKWMVHNEPFTSETFMKVLNDIFDGLIGVKQRLVWS